MFYREFVNFCQFSRNLSPVTVANYCSVLSRWSQFLGEHSLLSESVRSSDVLQFLSECLQGGAKPSSCNQYLAVLSSYYRYCVRFHHDVVRESPCEGVQPMKTVKNLPVCIPRSILDRVAASLSSDTFKQARSRAIFLLLYHCGLRRAEALGLQDSDFDFANRVVRVLGKGAKVRIVPMSVSLVDAMQRYISLRSVRSPYVNRTFVTMSGEPLSQAELAVIVRQILAGWVSPALAHPHILRHSFATACLEGGVSIENISALRGHSSVSTTQRYLSISPSRLLAQLKGIF